MGIATKIPPHNLGEVVAALEALVQQPDITTQQLMQHTPAPDFPTGGHGQSEEVGLATVVWLMSFVSACCW